MRRQSPIVSKKPTPTKITSTTRAVNTSLSYPTASTATKQEPLDLHLPMRRGIVEICQPCRVQDNELRELLASALSVDVEAITLTNKKRGCLSIEFDFQGAEHRYQSDEDVAKQLQSDTNLRVKLLSQVLLFDQQDCFGFSMGNPPFQASSSSTETSTNHSSGGASLDLSAHQPREFWYLQNTKVFQFLNDSLKKIAKEQPSDPFWVLAEMACPERYAAHQAELDSALTQVVSLRNALVTQEQNNDLAKIKKELEEEKQERQVIERQYRHLYSEQECLREELEKAKLTESYQLQNNESLKNLNSEICKLKTYCAEMDTKCNVQDEMIKILEGNSQVKEKELRAKVEDLQRETQKEKKENESERQILLFDLAESREKCEELKQKCLELQETDYDEIMDQLNAAEKSLRERTMQLSSAAEEIKMADAKIAKLEQLLSSNH